MGAKLGNTDIKKIYLGNTEIKKAYLGNILVYSSFTPGDDFTDPRDGEVYGTVQIGTQVWMTENLRYLPSVVGPAVGSEDSGLENNPYYYVYDYDGTDVATAKASANYSTYGVLYNRNAAIISAPTGWHCPTDAELYTLENYLSTGTCTADRTIHECDPAGTALKVGGSSGYEALLSGYRDDSALFSKLGIHEYIWSSTGGDDVAWLRGLLSTYTTVYRGTYAKLYGYSLRCLKD